MSDNPRHESSRLDAYLDHALNEADRNEFERATQQDTSLRLSFRRQESIDQALNKMFEPPDAERIDQWCQSVVTTAQTSGVSPRLRWWKKPLLAAASLAIIATAAWQTFVFLNPAPVVDVYAKQPWRSMAQVYHDEVAGGFKPKVVCHNDEQFAAFVADRFRHAVLLTALPTGLEALGWSYSNSISPRTSHILCRVNSANVLVFVDRLEVDNSKSTAPATQLNVFRRAVGPLVLYEVTPLAETSFLDRFYEPPYTYDCGERQPRRRGE